MSDEIKSQAPEVKTTCKNGSSWIGIIDKLTDPIELLIGKIASGRFLMAVITTYFICEMSAKIAIKYPDLAPVVVASMFSAWTGMVGFYFGGAVKNEATQKKEKNP